MCVCCGLFVSSVSFSKLLFAIFKHLVHGAYKQKNVIFFLVEINNIYKSVMVFLIFFLFLFICLFLCLRHKFENQQRKFQLLHHSNLIVLLPFPFFFLFLFFFLTNFFQCSLDDRKATKFVSSVAGFQKM